MPIMSPKRKRGSDPIADPTAILVIWNDDGTYDVGPENPEREHNYTFDPRFRTSHCSSRLAARQAVSRWKKKLDAHLVIGEAILEGR